MSKHKHFEDARISAYFSHLVTELGREEGVQVVCVAHMVSNTLHFLPALDEMFGVGLLLPKPKSTGSRYADAIRDLGYDVETLDREWPTEPVKVAELFSKLDSEKRILLLDIGGYFAESLNEVNRLLRGRIAGVVEVTENGVQKYLNCVKAGVQYEVPLVTVARTDLKLPEDYLVGAGVVFSVENTLRQQSQILQSRSACVLGFGRVGMGVAEVLRGRGIPTLVHDKSPLAMANAAARGFRVYRRLDTALQLSNLVISATGNHGITMSALASVRSGTVIATVTSADDEFEAGALEDVRYDKTPISARITRYDERDDRRYFWLINGGNAANFLDDAVVGPAIQLVEGGKLAALKELVEGTIPKGAFLGNVSRDRQRIVAEIWNEHFLDD